MEHDEFTRAMIRASEEAEKDDLGFTPWERDIYDRLLKQVSRRGIPIEIVPTLAKWLARIDWDADANPLFTNSTEVSATFGGLAKSRLYEIADSRSAYPYMERAVRKRSDNFTTDQLWFDPMVRYFKNYRWRRGQRVD